MLKTQNKRGQHLLRMMCPVSVLPLCSRRGKENQLMSEVRIVERNMTPHRGLDAVRQQAITWAILIQIYVAIMCQYTTMS